MSHPVDARVQAPSNSLDDRAQDANVLVGLPDMGATCQVQDVEAGRIAPSVIVATVAPAAKQSVCNGQGIITRAANGSLDITVAPVAGDFGPSFANVLNGTGSTRAPDAQSSLSPFKTRRSTSFQHGKDQPPSRSGTAGDAPAPARVFKQAPAHDEHHEAAASVIFTPKQTYDHIVATGVAKTHLSLGKQITQGVLAGFYISFSFMLCMTVGGQIDTIQHEHPGIYNFILGAVGFPLGLTVIMVVGADLFTSSCMYMMTAWLEGRVATYYVIKNWVISWFSNLCGCLIMAQLVVWAGLFAPPKNTFAIYLAHKKTAATFGATVCKGIICNWLVNLAVWMANSARDVTGKAIGVYLPVSAFVTLGTEHVIANQFQLSVAKMLGSGIPLHTIICSNWIPATIGNIIGGAFFVGTLYAGCYGTLYERLWLRYTQAYVFLVPKRTRERIAAAQAAAYDRLFGWIDWEALTAPPEPLDIASATAAAKAIEGGLGQHIAAGAQKEAAAADGGQPGQGGEQPPSGRVSASGVMACAARSLVGVFVNPPMTPFERKRTNAGLGSDVV